MLSLDSSYQPPLDVSRRSAYAAIALALTIALPEGIPCTAPLAVVRIWLRPIFVCTVVRACPECAHSARVSCRQTPGSACTVAMPWLMCPTPCHLLPLPPLSRRNTRREGPTRRPCGQCHWRV